MSQSAHIFRAGEVQIWIYHANGFTFYDKLSMNPQNRSWLIILVLALFVNGFTQSELKLMTCCNGIDSSQSQKVLSCVNSSASARYGLAPEQESQPALRVTILTRVSPEVVAYGAYSYLVQSLYGLHNGYTLLPLWPDSGRPDYRYHRKLVPIIDELTSSENVADYIVWIDAGVLADGILNYADYFIILSACYIIS